MACVPRSWVQGLFPTGLVGLSHVPVTLTEKETSPRSWDEHYGGLEHTTLLKPAQITTGVNGQADPCDRPIWLWRQGHNPVKDNFNGISFNFLKS